MPKIVLICGAPGAGKSTLAADMLRTGKVDYHFEADMFLDYGKEWTIDAAKAAHAKCQRMAEMAMQHNLNIAIANTFTKKWERLPYLHLAAKYGYTVEKIRLTGEYQNIHNVPASKVEQMRSNWESFEND